MAFSFFFGIRLTMAICLSIQMSGVVQSTGTCELLMINFRNPSEQLYDTSCCDQFCAGQCDPIFRFGLDIASGSQTDCYSTSYFSKTTGTYQDQNNVFFNDNMNGVNNPILWSFTSWPGTVLFKVCITDDDYPYSNNDDEDAMVQNLTLTPAPSKSTASSTTITIYGLRPSQKTTLTFTYKCYCDAGYTGSTCSI